MVRIRSANEIILNMVELLRVTQPNLDTKIGTVPRDIVIDPAATVVGQLYDELSNVSNLQSMRFVVGSDLDSLLSNYGLSRKLAAKASGVALFTFNALPTAVSINKNDLVIANNGASFAVANGVSILPANSNLYRSVATKYKNDLDFLNITDQFAVEITVQATMPGSSGNLSKYGLVKTTIPGVSNVTNVVSFSGGTNQEDDASYRNRGLAIFSGSSTGTSLGYKNTALTNNSVLDALVIEPGDPLMIRDGSVVITNEDGTYTILSEGSGGKVDIIILGNLLTEYIDSFIYQDKSNNNDPTDDKNIITLGQITGDEDKSINRRRIDNIKAGVLPAQPVDEILEVTGSLSGTNFIPKEIDSLGRVSGNYELIKDTGNFAGSPFGFDKFHWISDRVSLFEEDRIKSKFNGQDNVSFADVLEIPIIQQNIPITNENSTVVASDKSIIKVLHIPANNVTRVFNVNTGERYIVTDQNVDGSDNVNITGRIRISGNTLPSVSDVLQVDYNWIVNYDPFIDYDGKIINSNPRVSNDSIDWGLSNAVRNEMVLFVQDGTAAFYTGTVKHPITSVLSANLFEQSNGQVSLLTTGNFAGRLSVSLTGIINDISNIGNIVLKNSNLEIYKTSDNDGVFFSERLVINNAIRFNCVIVLPSDTPAEVDEEVIVFFNESDAFTVDGSAGNFIANQLTIPSTNIADIEDSFVMRVSYLSSIQDALTASITNLPVSRSGNSFVNNSNTGFVNNSISNIVKRENQTIQLNGSLQLAVTLNITSTDFAMTAKQVQTVVNLTNGEELWNVDNMGTVTTTTSNNYSLILTGYNAPAVGDNVVILYTADDIKRAQPFTFTNTLIYQNIQQLQYNVSLDQFSVNMQELTNDAVSFDIIDPTTELVIASGTGNLVSDVSSAALEDSSIALDDIDELLLKKIKISDSIYPNNNGTYDITSADFIDNTLIFANLLNNISTNQVSIIRLLDNKELWSSDGSIELEDNVFILPDGTNANENDYVIISVFNASNLRQAPSRLSITVADQINNTGIITIAGTTLTKLDGVVFTATNNGLKQSIAEAMRKSLGLTSNSAIPSSLAIARITKLEKVTTTTSGEILSTDVTYDILGSDINDNIYYANEVTDNDDLANLEFILPDTTNNEDNAPVIGDKLRITCYYSKPNDSESLSFTRNGTLFTNKLFAFIDRLYISSGFSSTSARFIISYFNQPLTGSRYKVFYDYTAPKKNERIIIRYNYNKLISDTTFAIEEARPINADVLIKAATKMLVDLTMNIVIKSEFATSAATVLQNTRDRLVSAINTNKLGDILDGSDLVTVAQSVDGVDRARILYFNENGNLGQVLSLIAPKNTYFSANNVLIGNEDR